jgi:predicted outer membrane repeat protein
MEGKHNQAEQHPGKPVDGDEATIAEAWQEQLAQAESSKLAAELQQAPPALYRRFARAYRDLLALSRARRCKLLRSMGMTLSGAALAFALALGQVPIARAAGIGVGGSCTLVDAITAANTDTMTGGCAAGSGADTITLSGNVTLTSVNNGHDYYYGANGLPQITSAITIEGNGFTIARDGGAPAFRIFQVNSSGNLTLNDTAITGGNANFGGGIYSRYGTLTLNGSTISGNIGNDGGGMWSRATVTLNDSTVSGNSSSGQGGGITNNSGTLILMGSTVSGNTAGFGGGISNTVSGTATVTNSTVSGNTASYEGGGISSSGGSTLTVTNSTVSGNTAGSRGGGIYGGGTLTLTNSTISGNTANGSGGGISNRSTLTLANSLVSGNTAPSGREIFNAPPFCMIDPPVCGPPGTINAANYNLLGHSGESNAQAFANFTPSGSGGDIISTSDGTNPTALAAILDTTLQNNGGDTETHALVTGSPAVDAAPSGPATDQRGIARPQGAAFDIGAFELEQVSNIAPVANNDSYSTNEDTALNVPAPGVLGNDSDADSDSLTAILVSGPAHGTLTLNPNGSFTYTPATNYSGSDSFSYKANDGTADSNIATVSLTVVSALDQIDELIAAVQALADSGTINGGQSNALITKLENAAGYVDSGQEAQAISKMQTFISQVNSFIGSGVLTSAEGQPLIDKANAIIQSLGG